MRDRTKREASHEPLDVAGDETSQRCVDRVHDDDEKFGAIPASSVEHSWRRKSPVELWGSSQSRV